MKVGLSTHIYMCEIKLQVLLLLIMLDEFICFFRLNFDNLFFIVSDNGKGIVVNLT